VLVMSVVQTTCHQRFSLEPARREPACIPFLDSVTRDVSTIFAGSCFSLRDIVMTGFVIYIQEEKMGLNSSEEYRHS
jgi:hypothetical protein